MLNPFGIVLESTTFMLMLSPSAGDNHLMNYSQPSLFIYETREECLFEAKEFNELNMPVYLDNPEETFVAYAWCKPIYEEQ